MDIIKWRESYTTGITSLDRQHQKLIGLINKLYKVIIKEDSSDSVEEVLSKLIEYAEKHLREEEAILETNGYPDFANHIVLHQSYLEEVKTLMAKVKKDKEAAVRDTYSFLRKWWLGHIVAEDQKYGEFLKAKGVE
jgi:hemerythrin-like metal-binding protein